MKNRLSYIALSLLIYGIAMSLPALSFKIVDSTSKGANNNPELATLPNHITTMTGAELTVVGFFGLMFLVIPAVIGWLANPVYWSSCLLFLRRQYKSSTSAALISISLGFLGTISTFWVSIPNGVNPSKLVLSKLHSGFWLWLAAPGAIALLSIFQLRKSHSDPK